MFRCCAAGQLVQRSIHDARDVRNDTFSVPCAFTAVERLHDGAMAYASYNGERVSCNSTMAYASSDGDS